MSTMCDVNLDETSPAGLSMSHWVDAYINVLLKTVVGDITVTKTRLQEESSEMNVGGKGAAQHEDSDTASRSPIFGGDKVIRILDRISIQSGAVVSQEEAFVHDLVWEILSRASLETTTGKHDQDDHKLNQFASVFVSDILQKVVWEERNTHNKCHEQKLTKIKAGSKKSFRRQCLKKQSRRNNANFNTQGSVVLDTSRHDVKPSLSVVVHNNPRGDYMYVRHRLLHILGPEVDNSVIQFVMYAMPQIGSWTQKFEAVEKRIKTIEERKKAGLPLITGSVDWTEKGHTSWQQKFCTAKKNGYLTILPDDDIQHLPTKEKPKRQSMSFSSEGLLSKMDRSLFCRGVPVFSRRGHKIIVV